MEPIELHPIYLRSSLEKSNQFSHLQNYSNLASEISAQQLNERIKRERSSPKSIEKSSGKQIKDSMESKSDNKRNFYNKKGSKKKNQIVVENSSHILDVRI
ncbi:MULTISPECIES: hypothetical protein [unclassified Thermosipho (in: thermotogales)]|uniref:hypothetical protein n=1 Tax=unclassified Thermosipho (in: thermotogales) TaxID=2676525 RepID=UPI00098682F9|nr:MULTISPECIES: hypothetical protein [unclassified Thermosipho (in: thermotogales)]MBT1247427.1 hypothetical protein [Thermosipho sp. 1244]OOC46322.1 hypothetical protein XO09_07915 [Thermosipho sp. 1223]